MRLLDIHPLTSLSNHITSIHARYHSEFFIVIYAFVSRLFPHSAIFYCTANLSVFLDILCDYHFHNKTASNFNKSNKLAREHETTRSEVMKRVFLNQRKAVQRVKSFIGTILHSYVARMENATAEVFIKLLQTNSS